MSVLATLELGYNREGEAERAGFEPALFATSYKTRV